MNNLDRRKITPCPICGGDRYEYRVQIGNLAQNGTFTATEDIYRPEPHIHNYSDETNAQTKNLGFSISMGAKTSN